MNSLLKKVTSFQDLTFDEMKNSMNQIMTGKISSNLVSAFITALAMKGETVDEISAAAQVLRENLLRSIQTKMLSILVVPEVTA